MQKIGSFVLLSEIDSKLQNRGKIPIFGSLGCATLLPVTYLCGVIFLGQTNFDAKIDIILL